MPSPDLLSGPMRRRLLCRLCAMMVVAGHVSLLRAEDAATPDSNSRASLLTLRQLDVFIDFEGEYTDSKVTSPPRRFPDPGRTQRNREWVLEQRVGFRFDGAFIDPSVMSFAGEISFGLTQNRFQESIDGITQTDSGTGNVLHYDLRADWLRGKPLSGSAYALRQDDRINRRFQPSLDQDRTGFGTAWAWSTEKLSIELRYDYLDTERTGNRDRANDEHYTESTLRYALDWRPSDDHRLRLAYEHAETNQEYQGLPDSFENSRDLLNIDHEWRLDRNREHFLRTQLYWQEESGDFARDLLRFGPQLTLQHSETLQTRYTYQLNRERYDGLDITGNRLDFQAIHQLYTNLTTTVDVFALYEDIDDDVDTTAYGGSVDWQYNRKNPYGHLHANLALAYDTEDVDGNDGTRIILNEAHTFRDPFDVFLRNRNVVIPTIVVKDAAGTRVYRTGVDYLIFQRGNVVELRRLRTGLIDEGDTILVDYQYRTPASGRLDTIRVDFSIEQRFRRGLTPYYRLSYRNQEDEVSTGFARRADRTNHHRIGVRYEQERYTLGAEFEIFDDTIDPYDAFHLDGLYHILQSPDHVMNASARLSRLFFEGGIDDRNVTLVDATVDHRWRLSREWSWIDRLSYRWEDDSIDGITQGWDVTTGLEYVSGPLTAELTFEYDRLDLPDSTQDDVGVFVRVRRELIDVLARR